MKVPYILGILNITSDSFSDGGLYLSPDDAIKHATYLVQSGADVVDIGPASSHPDSTRVSPEEEISRIGPVLDHLLSQDCLVSVDSFQPKTQIYCAERGVHFLNDTSGFPDYETSVRLAQFDCKLIVMHSIQQTGVASRSAADATSVIQGVYQFFQERLTELEKAGIDKARIIIDPGMGFFLGDTPEPSIAVLASIGKLRTEFGLPVCVSVSRKSFIQTLSDQSVENTLAPTLAAELFAANEGVDYIRTHDVAALRSALSVVEPLLERKR